MDLRMFEICKMANKSMDCAAWIPFIPKSFVALQAVVNAAVTHIMIPGWCSTLVVMSAV